MLTDPQPPEIRLEKRGPKGRYILDLNGAEAEMTWSRMSRDRIIVDHTFVPDAMRGTGAGRALVERLVADARKDGFKVLPLCPFVRGMAERHPEWSDVFV